MSCVRVELWWAMIFKVIFHFILNKTQLLTGSSNIIFSENLAKKQPCLAEKTTAFGLWNIIQFWLVIYWKMLCFACLIKQIWLGVGYFNRSSPKISYSYSKIGLEVTFFITLHNCTPQMPSSARMARSKIHLYTKLHGHVRNRCLVCRPKIEFNSVSWNIKLSLFKETEPSKLPPL